MEGMNRIRFPFLLFTLLTALSAAEFWDTSPPERWSSKDVQHLLTNSPWAHQTPVNLAGGNFDSEPGSGGDRDRGGKARATSDDGPDGGAQSNRRTGADNEPESPFVQPSSIAVRWDSALPVRLALATGMTATLPDLTVYRIVIADVFPALAGRADQKTMASKTTLSARGKSVVNAAKMEVVPRGKNLDFVFTFPRETVFSVEDKEIEFTTQFGGIRVRQRFRPKEMMFKGQTAL